MSADNLVAIVKFPEGYRVAECQAIENIDYYPVGSKKRKEVLKAYFGKSEVFQSEKEAQDQAIILAEECPILEYGIGFLGEYESFN